MTTDKVLRVLRYFERNRRMGHTTCMIKGVEEPTAMCMVLAVDKKHVQSLKDVGVPEEKIVTFDEFFESGFTQDLPLVLDHYTTETLMHAIIADLNKARADFALASGQLAKISDIIEQEL